MSKPLRPPALLSRALIFTLAVLVLLSWGVSAVLPAPAVPGRPSAPAATSTAVR